MGKKNKKTLFDRIGGKDVIASAVEVLYSKILDDNSISYLFDKATINKHINRERAYLSHIFGGPVNYVGKDMNAVQAELIEKGLTDTQENLISTYTAEAFSAQGLKDKTLEEVLETIANMKNTTSNNQNEENEVNIENEKRIDNMDTNAESRISELESELQQLTNDRKIDLVRSNLVDRSCLISMTDKKGIITYVNDLFCEVSGYTREECIGQNQNMVRHPKTPKETFKDLWSTIGTGNVWRGDIQNQCKDGSSYFVDALISPIIGDDGKPEGYIGVRYEKTRSVNEANNLKNAVDTTWASIEFSLDGIILEANDNFVKTLGYSDADEIIGQHHKMFCTDAFSSSAKYAAFWQNLAMGETQTGEFKRIRKDGSDVWINASYTPVKDRSGKVFKVIKIASDISDMVHAREEGEAIQSAVDAGWASISFTPDGTILEANDNFVSTLGYLQASELVGQHHRIFCENQYTNSEEYAAFWNELANGDIKSGEFKRIKKDGSTVWINASYTPIKCDQGIVYKVIKIATDISNVKIPILEVGDVLQSLSHGDLTKKYELTNVDGYGQEMGESLNSAIDNINGILSSISEMINLISASSEELLTKSDQMQATTQEVASAIQQMAEGAHEQASQTDEASQLVEGVLVSSTDMGAKADMINQAAGTGQKSAQEGLSTIKGVVLNMAEIQSSADTTSDSIDVLNERSEEIARTLNVITDIAAQTNLLALNAAIEAARAGDAGRGFAVVAEEIRKLAEDSRNSAIDIQKVISAVQKDITQAGKAIDKMGDSVKSGSQASKDAEEVFNLIENSTSQTFALSEEIQKASETQKESINSTVKNIEQIVVVSEETAAGAEQVATSSRELSQGMEEVNSTSNQLAEIATQLLEGVSRFTIKI